MSLRSDHFALSASSLSLFVADPLQKESKQLAQQYLGSFQPTKMPLSPFANVCRIYYQFCADFDVPPFPVVAPLVTLCVWWLTVKAPTTDSYPFVVSLNGLKKATSGMWEVKLTEEEKGLLMRFKPLEEFLIERGVKGALPFCLVVAV